MIKLEKSTLEIIKVLIDRIEIYQDKQIDIIFNFKKLNNVYNKNSGTNQFKIILKKQNIEHIQQSYFDKTKQLGKAIKKVSCRCS